MAVRRFLESARYMVVPAVLGLLAAALTTIVWAVYSVYDFARTLLRGDETVGLVKVLSMLDTFLLATVILVFALGLWELFVGDLDLPEWLEIHTLDDLKGKLADVIVLVVAIKALEKLTTAKKPIDALIYAAASGLIVLGLTVSSVVKYAKKRPEK
jgi:uncharacterized membrane protein YqhA